MESAETFIRRLGGKWHGRYGTAPCPVCQPEARQDQCALSISEEGGGTILLKCFKAGCSFRDLATALGITRGTPSMSEPAILAHREAERRAEADRRSWPADKTDKTDITDITRPFTSEKGRDGTVGAGPVPVLSVLSVLSERSVTTSRPVDDAQTYAAFLRDHGPATYGAAAADLGWGATRAWQAEARLRADGRVRLDHQGRAYLPDLGKLHINEGGVFNNDQLNA